MAVKKSLLGRPMTRGEWYTLSLAVVGGLMLLGAVLMFLVKTIKRRFSQRCDAQVRLSQAYREGFMREEGRFESQPWSQKGLDGVNGYNWNDEKRHNGSSDRRYNGSSGYYNGANGGNNISNIRGQSNHPNQRLMKPDQKKYGGVVDQFVTNRMQFDTTKDHKYFQTKIQVVNQSEGYYYEEEPKATPKAPQRDEGNKPIRAHLSIWYKENVLSITIHSLWGLPRMRRNLSCDPYVKLTLLPDSSLVAKTRIMRRTQNPVFEEQFDFYDVTKVDDVTVQLSVFTFDQYSKDCKIGEILFPVVEVVEDGWVEEKDCDLDEKNVSDEGNNEEKVMANEWTKEDEIKNEIDGEKRKKGLDEFCNKKENLNTLDCDKIIGDNNNTKDFKKNYKNNNNKENNEIMEEKEEKQRKDVAEKEERDSFFKDLCVDVPTFYKVKPKSQRDNLLRSFGFYYD